MELLIIGGVAFWYWTLVKGRLTSRAFAYLMVYANTASQDAANAKALSMGFMEASDQARLARAFADEFFDGKQLRMIAAARQAGFRG